jgi:hypothetical protein
MIVRLLLALLCLGVATSCVSRASMSKLRTRAAIDLGCKEDSLKGKEVDARTYHVWGCSKRATYVTACNYSPSKSCTWVLNSPVESYGVLAELERQEQQQPQQVTITMARVPEDATIETGRAKDGAQQLKLFMRDARAGWLLYFNVTPAAADPALVIWRLPKTHREQVCEIKVVADGQRLETGPNTNLTPRSDSLDYQSTLPYASLMAMARSNRVVARVCELEAVLTETQLAKLRELIVRIQEAHAWNEAKPAAQGTPTEL